MERQDALLAAKLSREESNGARGSRTKRKASSASGPSKTKRAAHNKNNSDGNRINSSNNNNPFNREMALSADLQRVIGEEMCSRPQVVKKLWAYIKENDLQNPSDKRQIMCDEKLQQLFKKKTVGAFEMNRILSKHIFKPDEIGESGESGANAPEPQKSSDVDDDEEDLEKDAQQLEDEISEAEY
ncbi:uncharacterized protein LODBEIA_P30320 [Lodderomyces beijingensis]|uniref:DM2 domain-containing protein n=1 Tax=Lodderomyces beijingensis TaxID=1775926 RepID=A0ABP0ZMD1_9ASCO